MRPVFALAPAVALAGCVTITSSPIGTFAGVMPCADCSGILTELRLYTEQPSGRPARYELTETYLDAIVVQLDLGRIDARKNFVRVGEDELRLIDFSDANEILARVDSPE